MWDYLPLRSARPASGWFRTPLVQPDGVELAEGKRPRIYIAPLESSADLRILLASLAAAGLTPPRWVPARRARVTREELGGAFLRGEPVLVPIVPPRRGPDRLARLLTWAEQHDQDVDLVPVEVLWGPAGRTPSLWNLPLGNPYDPPEWERWLRVRGKDRVRVLLGAPGTYFALRADSPHPNDGLALSAFVREQAVKALSQTERQVLGERYKVPRFVVEQILGEAEFQDRAAAAGASIGLTHRESFQRAESGLRELATGHNLFYMELFHRFARWLYRRVYEPEIVVQRHELERLQELGKRAALVFVPSHKSNFDHLVMYHLLFTSGFPPPHTAAGINMSFFPMSRILPRTGAYFIRRSSQDDPIYTECLRAFILYLVQRRFHQEFFIEGGRTRSGKLLPPRYGILRYIVEGGRKTDAQDVYFIPTAISYSQIFEVEGYVREQLGEEKETESFMFLVRMIRALRGRRLGRIHIRFAEPIDLRGHMERSGDERLVIEKLAFQISNQINAVTTLTPVSVLCTVLLGAGRRALTSPELHARTQRVLDYARERGIALAQELERGAEAAVGVGLAAMQAAGFLETYDQGIEPVHSVPESSRHIASYYRNTIIHFFLVRAITSLAREAAKERDSVESWALRLRELLKFDFFFAERDAFRAQMEREEVSLRKEEEAGLDPMAAAGSRILMDYLESYFVVTQTLQSMADDQPLTESDLLRRCLAVGRQLLYQDRVHAPELLSRVNFRNALQLALNLGAAERCTEGYRPGDRDALSELARDLDHLARLARVGPENAPAPGTER